MFSALGQEWTCEFPFSAKRALEEKHGKGFYGVTRLIMPATDMDMSDFETNPAKVLEMLGDVRLGVVADFMEAGCGMTAEQAEEAIDEIGLVSCIGVILKAAFDDNKGVAETGDAPLKQKTRKKKPTG